MDRPKRRSFPNTLNVRMMDSRSMSRSQSCFLSTIPTVRVPNARDLGVQWESSPILSFPIQAAHCEVELLLVGMVRNSQITSANYSRSHGHWVSVWTFPMLHSPREIKR